MNKLLPLSTITLLATLCEVAAATRIVGPGGYATIQEAVNYAADGDLIRVTNGTYASANVNKRVRVRSMNGPQYTTIAGPNSVFMSSGASLSGFTLKGGGLNSSLVCGQDATNAFVTNCIISGAWDAGGNGTDGMGGGAFKCTLYQCLVTGNYASYGGGGAAWCILYNCTVASNSSVAWGGGVYQCTLYNSIVCSNTAHYPDSWESIFYNCFGGGDPRFVDPANGNFRLQPNSPCINAGNNAYVAGNAAGFQDLDGRLRIVDDTVDVGPYEFQPDASGAFIAWLQQYGLPTSGLADYDDSDNDGRNNWQEWVCGTCPTNPLSVLRVLWAAPVGSQTTVAWQSVPGVNYLLMRSASPTSPLTLVATNITGQAGTTTYADADATGAGPYFYRVGVPTP
jgi:hypothetical protein